jgi:hypothetical protein
VSRKIENSSKFLKMGQLVSNCDVFSGQSMDQTGEEAPLMGKASINALIAGGHRGGKRLSVPKLTRTNGAGNHSRNRVSMICSIFLP